MDIANKFNNYDHRKFEAKVLNLFHKKKDGLALPRKEDLGKKLAKMKTLGLKSLAETDWMFKSGLPPQHNFNRHAGLKNDALRFS